MIKIMLEDGTIINGTIDVPTEELTETEKLLEESEYLLEDN